MGRPCGPYYVAKRGRLLILLIVHTIVETVVVGLYVYVSVVMHSMKQALVRYVVFMRLLCCLSAIFILVDNMTLLLLLFI